MERDRDTLLKPEWQTPGTLAELALKPLQLLLWVFMVDLVPEEEEVKKGMRGKVLVLYPDCRLEPFQWL